MQKRILCSLWTILFLCFAKSISCCYDFQNFTITLDIFSISSFLQYMQLKTCPNVGAMPNNQTSFSSSLSRENYREGERENIINSSQGF